MKSLAQYIEELIIQHECVIIPNLGGFLTYRDKAIVHNNIFYAPTECIRFNSLLTYHDGLLAEAYMRDRNISYPEALNAINADVEQIKKSLNNGNPILFGRIGALTISTDNNITLINSKPKFLPENIGLPVVYLKQLSTTTTKNNNTIILNVPRVSSNTLRYVAMLTVIFLLSILIPTPVTDTTHEASFYKVQSTNSINAIDTINTINTIDTINTTKPQKTLNSQFSILNSQFKYHLIIASLTTQAEAEEYIAHHTHFDRNQLLIIESKGKFRISAAGFNKYKDALQYMDSIRNDVPSARKAWIMCK